MIATMARTMARDMSGRSRDASALAGGRVHPLAHLLAGLEVRDALGRNVDGGAGLRIAAEARGAPMQRETAKAANLHAILLRQRIADLVEHELHRQLDVLQHELRMPCGETLDQLGLGHGVLLPGW